MPFGYLMFGTIWLIGTIGLMVFVIRSLMRRNIFNFRFGFAIAGLTLSAAILVANVVFSNSLNVNPLFTRSDLTGSWMTGSSEFRLEQDGSAIFAFEPTARSRIGVSNGPGYWKRVDDFMISLSNQRNVDQPVLRVIRFNDQYRIVIEDYGDFDQWDGDLGFRKLED